MHSEFPAPDCSPDLETHSRLKLDDAAGQARCGAPEIERFVDVGARGTELEGRQIERVEQVEEVGAQFQVRRFTEVQRRGQRQPGTFPLSV